MYSAYTTDHETDTFTSPSFYEPERSSYTPDRRLHSCSAGRSGDLTWNAPTQVERFDFAITVQEWRNGILLSQTQYEQVIVIIDQAGGTSGTIPPYEPAQLIGEGIITGVTEPEEYHNVAVSVFPVPTHEQLQVTITLVQSSSVTLHLIDPAGRMLYEAQQTPVLQHVRSIDVRALPPGLYFLRALINGQTVTRKALKR